MLHPIPYNHWPPTYHHPRWATHQAIACTLLTLRLAYAASCIHSINKFLKQGTKYMKVYKSRQDLKKKIDKILIELKFLSFQFLVCTVPLPSETLLIPLIPAVLQISSKAPIKTSSFLIGVPIKFCLYLTLTFTSY